MFIEINNLKQILYYYYKILLKPFLIFTTKIFFIFYRINDIHF